METKIMLSENQKELTILQGKALDPLPAIKLQLVGTIDAPKLFLQKRLSEINQKKSNICFNYETKQILLTIEETDPYNTGSIIGKIELSDDFTKFKINTGECWSCFDLADFIKMNRSHFESKDVAGKLVNQLRTFKAKVDKEIEQSKDDKANYSIKRSQVVNSNLPNDFTILVKIFKGGQKELFPVEINIHPDTLNCILISPAANDLIQATIEKAINDEIEQIKLITPDIVIIEQ